MSETVAAFGESIDVLVNKVKKLEDLTAEDFDQVFRLNVRGVLLLTQAVVPRLRAPGRIINMSSTVSQIHRVHGVQGRAVLLRTLVRWATLSTLLRLRPT